MASFLNRIHPYSQLKREEHWEALGKTLAEAHADDKPGEAGRLLYPSIPPRAYATVAEYINKYLRPSDDAWLRVIFEKPFGSDTNSATALAESLTQHLSEEEIYRVDHYLGKAGVQVKNTYEKKKKLFICP